MPTDHFIQSIAQGGHSVALMLLIVTLAVAIIAVSLGAWLEHMDARREEHQRRLAESQERARKIIGDHWADRHIIKR